MLKEYPLMNGYWESKIPKFENIRIPAYVTGRLEPPPPAGARSTGSARSVLPRSGCGCTGISSGPTATRRWNLEDLKRFFDRYLKGIRNGWELTPRVRIDVMDAYDYDYQVNRPEKEFPLARTKYTKLYLDAAKKALSSEPVATVSKASYDANEGTDHLRHHVRRRHRDHRLYEGPPLGGGRWSRRDGSLPHRA